MRVESCGALRGAALCRGLRRQRPGHTQPDIAVPVSRPLTESLGRAQHAKGFVPGATAQDACRAIVRFVSAAIARRAGIRQVTVLHPFPRVAQHVMQPPGIRTVASHRRGEPIAVLAEWTLGPGAAPRSDRPVGAVGVHAGHFVVSPGPASRAAGTCGVLPFRLAGQSPALDATLLVEPANVGLRVHPAYSDDGFVLLLRPSRLAPATAAA